MLSVWRGVARAAIIGIAFATNSVLAAVSYTGGADALSMVLLRTTVAFVVLHLLLGRRGVARTLPPARRLGALGIGLIFATYTYGVLVAIGYLPVALVVATFYTFPIFVAITEWWSGRESFSPRTALALALAFAGILLALDVFGTRPHPLGVALALLGAVGVTLVLNLSARVRGTGDSRPVTLHMLGTAATVFIIASVVHGGVALPHTTYAWVGFIGAPLFYSFAIITLFVVLGDLGPVRTSLVMNVEPVASVALGYLLLDQRLHALQIAGIALVVGAVLLIEGRKLGRAVR